MRAVSDSGRIARRVRFYVGQQHRYASARAARPNFGVVVVNQQTAWVIERFGKFHQILDPGLHFLIPVVDRIAYVHSLKEEAVIIPNQMAITRDNVTIQIDGVLYLRVEDAYKASYGVEDAVYAVTQLAQTTMRSELGKLTLDKTFEERDSINTAIVGLINEAAHDWGISCMRYEIRDIIPPASIRQAMEMEAEAERRKRAEILQSEAEQKAEVNVAEGKRQSAVLHAEGEAETILQRASATSDGVKMLASAISGSKSGKEATFFNVAQKWVDAWKEVAQKSHTIVVPSTPGNPAALVTTAMGLMRHINQQEGIRAEDDPAEFTATERKAPHAYGEGNAPFSASSFGNPGSQ